MQRLTKSHRNAMLMGASALVLCAAAPSAVFAQAAAQEAVQDTAVDEIVVTGQRAQIQSAQKIKQNAEVIVDSITAVDIGALPDRSVSEALQRISGITLQRTNEARDPARMAAEGGGVAIRGLSWVRSETNGRDIFSAKNGRGLSFEDVSADLMAGVDVYKNPSADMIEGGIGGTVNLRTRLPFDQKGHLLAASVDYNYGDLMKKGYKSGNFIASDRWDTGIGEVGALIAYSYSQVGNRTNSVSTDRYDAVTLSDGSTRYVPKTMGWRAIDWQQTRQSLAMALQWSPNVQWDFSLQAMGSQADTKDIDHSIAIDNTMSTTSANGYTYDDAGMFVKGTVYDAQYNASTRYGDSRKRTADIGLNGKFYASDRVTITGDLQYVRSTARSSSLSAWTQLQSSDLPDVTFDLSGDLPTVSLANASALSKKSSYYWAAAMDHLDSSKADEGAGRLDLTYEFDDDNWLKSFRFGARATNKNFETRETNWNWSLLSAQYWGGGTPVYLTDSATANQSELYNYNNFFGGDRSVGSAWFPTASLVNQGSAHAYSLLKNTETAGWGWSPLDSSSYSSSSENNQTEQTYATYGLLRFGHDTLFGRDLPLDGNIGLRVVRTETTASGAGNTLTALSLTNCAGSAACIAALKFSAGTSITTSGAGSSGGTDYTDVLPSLNLRLHISPQLQLRFAASKAIVRPTMSQLQPYTSLSFDFTTATDSNGNVTSVTSNGANSAGAYATGGNPNLRPVKSNQFDASLEWYFAPTGSLTFALFRKDITDYIFTDTAYEAYTSNGQTINFLTTRYYNGSEGKVSGFEVGYQQFYDFLPGALSGLGAQANYTYIDNEGGRNASSSVSDSTQVAAAASTVLPLEGMSSRSYNLAVMYEKYGVSARLAYNWRQRYLLTSSAANVNAPVWSRDYGQLDGSIFYTINSHYKVGFQGTNLLKERTVLEVGYPGRTAPYNWVQTDRRVAAVLRASF